MRTPSVSDASLALVTAAALFGCIAPEDIVGSVSQNLTLTCVIVGTDAKGNPIWDCPATTTLAVASPIDPARTFTMSLYQGGASYDLPVVFFEGFDPRNRLNASHYVHDLQTFFESATSGAGFDVWIVDASDGGGDVRQTARELAKAVDVAYKHLGWNASHVGEEVAAVGVSMGALAGRFMLASWEDGRYRDPGHAEFIDATLGNGTNTPPVSVFVAVAGSQQTGANVPLAIQALVQTIRTQDPTGQEDVVQALNSVAARQMLAIRVDDGRCSNDVGMPCESALDCGGQCSQTGGPCASLYDCPGFNHCVAGTCSHTGGPCEHTSDCPTDHCSATCDGGCDVMTPIVYSIPLEDGTYHRNITGAECATETVSSSTFYADVNSRGLLGNGYPTTVGTVAMVNADWLPQMRPDDGTSLHSGDQIGQITADITSDLSFFEGIWCFFTGCPEHIVVVVHIGLGSRDLAPGDLGARSLNDVQAFDTLDLPNSLATVTISQDLPFLHVPTASALHCNEQTDYDCAWENRNAGRFSLVFTRVLDQDNGEHIKLEDALGLRIMAVLFDGFYGDGDAYWESTNPLVTSGDLPSIDCWPGDAVTKPLQHEVCNGADDNCDGLVDELIPGAWCNSGQPGSCAIGLRWCEDAQFLCHQMVFPHAEVCNGYDDDCDGQTDEYGITCGFSVPRPGGGVCHGGGIAQCSGGVVTGCTPKETCGNGVDDDCDGQIDEGCPICTSCFVAGTPIALADGTQRAIEGVRVGDAVLAFDESSGAVVASQVTQTFVHPGTEGTVLVNGTLRATANHPVFANGWWVRADELAPGDVLVTLPSAREDLDALGAFAVGRVTSLESVPGVQTTYNLEVNEQHNYFAGGVLVHNKVIVCGPPIPKAVD